LAGLRRNLGSPARRPRVVGQRPILASDRPAHRAAERRPGRSLGRAGRRVGLAARPLRRARRLHTLSQRASLRRPSSMRGSAVAYEKRTHESAPKASPGTAATWASERSFSQKAAEPRTPFFEKNADMSENA